MISRTLKTIALAAVLGACTLASTHATTGPRCGQVDIGALTLNSDFTVFLQSDCPSELRLQGLRKLWSLLPQAPVEDSAAV